MCMDIINLLKQNMTLKFKDKVQGHRANSLCLNNDILQYIGCNMCREFILTCSPLNLPLRKHLTLTYKVRDHSCSANVLKSLNLPLGQNVTGNINFLSAICY